MKCRWPDCAGASTRLFLPIVVVGEFKVKLSIPICEGCQRELELPDLLTNENVHRIGEAADRAEIEMGDPGEMELEWAVIR